MQLNLLDFEIHLFDLDGTLVNTEPLHLEAYRLTIERLGFQLVWTFEEYLNHALVSRPHLFKALYHACPGLEERLPNGEALRQQKMGVYRELLASTPPSWMPGAFEHVDHLLKLGKKLAIVTNSPKSQVEAFAHLQLSKLFLKIITVDDFLHPKPHPAGYQLALQSFKANPKKTIVYEDSLKGVQSASAANLAVVLIATEHYKKQMRIDPNIPSAHSFEKLWTHPNALIEPLF